MKRVILGSVRVVCASAAFVASVWAVDVAIIVNKANTNAIDKAFITKIYTGQIKNWPDGGPIVPLDQSEENSIRMDFNTSILNKSSANMKALWAQNIFTGKGIPPKVIDSDTEVKKAVSANKNAIGYVRSSSVDDTVKAVVK